MSIMLPPASSVWQATRDILETETKGVSQYLTPFDIDIVTVLLMALRSEESSQSKLATRGLCLLVSCSQRISTSAHHPLSVITSDKLLASRHCTSSANVSPFFRSSSVKALSSSALISDPSRSTPQNLISQTS